MRKTDAKAFAAIEAWISEKNEYRHATLEIGGKNFECTLHDEFHGLHVHESGATPFWAAKAAIKKHKTMAAEQWGLKWRP